MNNSVNSNMHLTRPNVGLIPLPENGQKKLFTDTAARQKFRELDKQLKTSEHEIKYDDRKKTYLGAATSIGLVGLALIIFSKKAGAKIKGLFQKAKFWKK